MVYASENNCKSRLATKCKKDCYIVPNFKSAGDRPHLMAGPIVGKGLLIGTVHFGRGGDTTAFQTEDLLDLSTICCHFSACLAMLRVNSIELTSELASYLTKRELQIVELAGLKQKLSPNEAQTGFISSKQVTIHG